MKCLDKGNRRVSKRTVSRHDKFCKPSRLSIIQVLTRTPHQAQKAKGLEHHLKQNNGENTNACGTETFIFLAALGISKMQKHEIHFSHHVALPGLTLLKFLDKQVDFKIKIKRFKRITEMSRVS